MEVKLNVLPFPGTIPCQTGPKSYRWVMELQHLRGPNSRAGRRRVHHIWPAGQKWPETVFLWNLNSQASSALVKSIELNSFPCSISVLMKYCFPQRSSLLKNSWQAFFTELSWIRADTCVFSCFLWGNLHFDSFMTLAREKLSFKKCYFFS